MPRCSKDIGVICVQRATEEGKVKEIWVNRSRVLAALIWLKQNNALYRNIEIDKKALNDLPENGPLNSIIVKDDQSP